MDKSSKEAKEAKESKTPPQVKLCFQFLISPKLTFSFELFVHSSGDGFLIFFTMLFVIFLGYFQEQPSAPSTGTPDWSGFQVHVCGNVHQQSPCLPSIFSSI